MYGNDNDASDIFKYPYLSIEDHMNSDYKLDSFALHNIQRDYSKAQLVQLSKEKGCDLTTMIQLLALGMERDRMASRIEYMERAQKEYERKHRFHPIQFIQSLPWPDIFRDLLIFAGVCFFIFLGILRYQSNSSTLDNAYNNGYKSGQDSGHDEGYEEGFSDGYSSGFDDGLLKND